MRVVYSFPHPLGSAGIGTTAWHHVNELVRAGHEVHVVAASIRRPIPGLASVVTTLEKRGVVVPSRAVGRLRAADWHDRVSARVLGRLRPEVVHTWPLAGRRTLRRAAELGIPGLREVPNTHTAHAYEVVAAEYRALGLEQPSGGSHTSDRKRLAIELEEYELASGLLVPSDAVAQTFLDRGIDPAKLLRVRYGATVPAHQVVPRSAGPLRATFVGRGDPRKGLHVALAAWVASEASREGTFSVVGTVDPDYLAAIGENARHPSVRLTGFLHDPLPELAAADVLVLASVEEGSALVTYEAQAMGCVPLVSAATGAVVEHGVHGLVHPVGDVATLRDQFTLLAGNRDELERLRAGALGHVDELTWEAAGLVLVEAYRKAVAALGATATGAAATGATATGATASSIAAPRPTRRPVHVELLATLDEKYLAGARVFAASLPAATIVLELPPDARRPDGSLDPAPFLEAAARWATRESSLQMRLRPSPLRLTPPMWVPVDQLDVTDHVHLIDARELSPSDLGRVLCGDVLPPMPRDAPLWRMIVADRGEEVAVVLQIQHALGDGVVAVRLMNALTDTAPVEDPSPGVIVVPAVRAPGTGVEGLARSWVAWWRAQDNVAAAWDDVARKSPRMRLRRWAGRLLRSRRDDAERQAGRHLPPSREAAMRGSDLAAVRKAARALGGSVSDVVIAAALLAVRTAERTDPGLLVPIHRRSTAHGSGNNKMAVTRVSLAGASDMAGAVPAVAAQVAAAVAGDDEPLGARDWPGYASYLGWQMRPRWFGRMPVRECAFWPTLELADEIAVFGTTYAQTFAITVKGGAPYDVQATADTVLRLVRQAAADDAPATR